VDKGQKPAVKSTISGSKLGPDNGEGHEKHCRGQQEIIFVLRVAAVLKISFSDSGKIFSGLIFVL
jgi:hypothetical protein